MSDGEDRPIDVEQTEDTLHNVKEEVDIDTQAGQFPSSADDLFELRLIECVEKNQCIYNRCHPLHKMADYKTHVWNQIASELTFSGPGVELERKWRHMRDRYVRLRKLVKTSQPLKKNDKWFFYYQKMSFLDPYIEHRNRRKRGDMLNSLIPADVLKGAGLDSTETERGDDDGSDSGEGDCDVDPLKGFYASFLNQPLTSIEIPPETTDPSRSSQPSSSTAGATALVTRKRRVEEIEQHESSDETEVSLFVRSIHKTLSSMSPQTFALARLEISRVLYDCQYGKK